MRSKVLQRISALGFYAVIAVMSADLAQAAPTYSITATRNTPPGPTFNGGVCLAGNGGECWEPEPGQSMPTGTTGFIDGLIKVSGPGTLVFTYGAGLLAGDTGHGNSSFINEFWVGPSEAVAEANGWVFCTQADPTSCAKVSLPGDKFAVSTSQAVDSNGNLRFGFTFGLNSASTLGNGVANDTQGAYLATCAPINNQAAPNGGPCSAGYIGLTDSPYNNVTGGTDHDFQDLVVRFSVPEPASLLLLGFGLVGAAFSARRRKNSAA